MKRTLSLAAALLLSACQSVPAGPGTAHQGVYRALGNEPFWALTIDPARMTFEEPNGPTRIVQPTPRVIHGFAGEIYQTPRIGVNIVHMRCSDGMSDRVYPDRVEVDVDGQRWNGCGGEAVAPAALAGTSWRVAAINGRATPAGQNFFMNFEAKRFGAKFGCNGLGADYRQSGDTIIAGPVIGTQMACPDMSFETQGALVLSQPMRMRWDGGDRLTLSSGPQRTIALVRSY